MAASGGRSIRSIVFVPLAILACSLLGGVFAPGLEEVNAATTEEDVKQALKLFSKIYYTVEENSADPVSPDKGCTTAPFRDAENPGSALQLL